MRTRYAALLAGVAGILGALAGAAYVLNEIAEGWRKALR